MNDRIVVLVDMDCFYCQVETRLNPSLKGKPLAVVQYNTWKGGGIIAVNYEARAFGVTRHIRGNEAREKCKDIVLVHVPSMRGKADTTKYREAGREVVNVLCKFSDCVERASVDEAYMDITTAVEKRIKTMDNVSLSQLSNTFVVGYSGSDGDNNEEKRREGLETWLKNIYETGDVAQMRLAVGGIIVEEMRAAVLADTGFECSAGIAHNKVLGKLACGLHKPNRQTILPHSSVPLLYKTLSVKKIRSLGGKLGDLIVDKLGCKVMEDLVRFTEKQLQQRFDEKTGSWLYNIARGIENEPVTPRLVSKSIGCCKKFPGKQALSAKDEIEKWMFELASEVSERLTKDYEDNQRRAKLLTVSYSQDIDKCPVAASRSAPLTSYQPQKIADVAMELIKKSNSSADENFWSPPLKFLGLSAGKFMDENSAQSSKFVNFFKPSEKKECPPKQSIQDNKNVPEKQLESAEEVETEKKVEVISHSVKKQVKSKEKVEASPLPKKRGRFENTRLSPSEKENSFFMKYLQKKNLLKGTGDNTNGDREVNSKSKLDFQEASTSKQSDISLENGDDSNTGEQEDLQEMAEPMSQTWLSLSEMFPDLDAVEDDVIEILPSQLRKKLIDRKSKNKNEVVPEGTQYPSFNVEGDIMTVADIHEPDSNDSHMSDAVTDNKKKTKTLFACLEDDKSSSNVYESDVRKRIKESENPFRSISKNCRDTLDNRTSEDLDTIEYLNESSYSPSKTQQKFLDNRCNIVLPSADSHQNKTDSLSEEISTQCLAENINETCAKCGCSIPLVDFPEHSDFHVAEELQKELNNANKQPLKPVVNTQTKTVSKTVEKSKKGRPSKKVIAKNNSMRSITSFFAKT